MNDDWRELVQQRADAIDALRKELEKIATESAREILRDPDFKAELQALARRRARNE